MLVRASDGSRRGHQLNNDLAEPLAPEPGADKEET
jgi:hypothetical protein